jgi:epoxide hydrolase-like predicted phosphatase
MFSNHAIRAVIWDMGGVLVRNTVPEPRRRRAEKYGLTSQQLEDLVFGSPLSLKATLGEINVDLLWEFVRSTLNISPQEMPAFIADFWGSDRADEVLVDFIRSLRTSYKTGLLSNAFSDARQAIGSRFPGMLGVFDVSIFSSEVGLAKPDPRFYDLMLEKLGVAPAEAIFVDDFIENVQGAQAVGINAIQFRNPSQARQAVLERLSSNGAE